MPKNLEAAILPSGTISFEWTDTSEKIDKASQEAQKHLYRIFSKDNKRALFIAGLISEKIKLSESLSFWRKFAALYVKELLIAPDIEEKRGRIKIPFSDDHANAFLESAPPMVGLELLDAELLSSIWKLYHKIFTGEISAHEGTVESLLRKLTPNHTISNRIHFHLVENRKNDNAPFAFMATYSTSMEKSGLERHIPLQYALKEFSGNNRKLLELLAAVHKSAKTSSLIKDLLDSGDLFHPIGLNTRDAYQFLKEVSLYEEAGILCRIPRWWTGSPKKISLGLSLGETSPGSLGMSSILDVKALLHINGEPISEKDAREILGQYSGLAFIKGKWIAVDKESLEKTLTIFEKARRFAKKNKISLSDAMQFLMGTSRDIEVPGVDNENILCGSWLKSVLEKMANPSLVRTVKPGKRVLGKLRPYQQLGLNWLHFLHTIGFGMCLADDMGLGKTLQVLALLQTLKENSKNGFKTCLLIVPASLMSNWQAEIKKFTPHLKIIVAHPQITDKIKLEELPKKLSGWDLVITTYAMARKLTWLKKENWFYTILDEAQAIKNPLTSQTTAVKEIGGRHRLILTGTPIENRLSDLWSLFDFINPGLLGGAKKFTSFAKGLKDNPAGYGRLRQVVNPYILRRLKTDKSIITDLPDKVEMKCYADLSKNQVVLYKNLVEELEAGLHDSSGIKRRGIILGFLTKFKQLCNHPDQLTGQKQYKEKLGGKFARLREICETIYEKREKLLLFTQFREVIEPLDSLLTEIFNCRGKMLHGGTNVKKRKDAVTEFQSDGYIPYFILSLKAGGLGLNLTAANHVIHFDRWWNPAVENQATDRAFRIGQKKNVIVHKFICRGTIEEKIDGMIEEKKSLSSKVLGASSENWLTEYPDDKLIDMFKLNL